MRIYPFDKEFNDVFDSNSINDIKTDGITIRSGNKVIRLQVTEETALTEDDSYRAELEKKFMDMYGQMKEQFDLYKGQMKDSLRIEKEKIRRAEEELNVRMNQVSVLPKLEENHLRQGLSVAVHPSGFIWEFKTVYAPKMVGPRRIEPAFAKRMITPIVITVITDNKNTITNMTVNQIIGNKKFLHYHSMSSNRDCWGNFKYSGKIVTTPDEMVEFCKGASFVLETINDMSIANRNPPGLPRYNTLLKHLLDEEVTEETSTSRSQVNTRNNRSGVTADINQDIAENVWSV